MLEIQYVPDHVIRRVVDMYVYIYCASDLIDMPPVAAQAGGRLLYYKKQTSELADMYRHHRIQQVAVRQAGRQAGRQGRQAECMQAGSGVRHAESAPCHPFPHCYGSFFTIKNPVFDLNYVVGYTPTFPF
jgi:hypothetical protein